MIKKVKFINYEEEIYKIFMDQNNLYCSVSNKVLELSSGIEDYCLEYFNNSIWIAFYDKTYRISLIEICLKYNEEILASEKFWKQVMQEKAAYFDYEKEWRRNKIRDIKRFLHEPQKIKSILYRLKGQ